MIGAPRGRDKKTVGLTYQAQPRRLLMTMNPMTRSQIIAARTRILLKLAQPPRTLLQHRLAEAHHRRAQPEIRRAA